MEVIGDEHTAEALAEHLQRTCFEHYAINLYVCDVGVLRPAKFDAWAPGWQAVPSGIPPSFASASTNGAAKSVGNGQRIIASKIPATPLQSQSDTMTRHRPQP